MFQSIKKIFSGKPGPGNEPNGTTQGGTGDSRKSSAVLGSGSDGSEAVSETAGNPVFSEPVADSGSPKTAAPVDLPLPTPTELKLEALFAHAAHEASKRNAFLEALMGSELFVIGSAEPAPNAPGGAMNIQLATQVVGQEPVALAFTSQAAMSQAGAPLGQPFVKIKTQDLMRMIRGQLGFILNPGNRVAKHFNKWEVEQLTGGTGGATGGENSGIREMPMPTSDSVSIGQPAQYPDGLRESLAATAKEMAEISAIHLGLMAVNEASAPVLLAVVSTTNELTREEFLGLVNRMGASVSRLGPIPLNFAPMNPNFMELVEKRALIDVSESLS